MNPHPFQQINNNLRDYSVTAVLSNRCTQNMLKITYYPSIYPSVLQVPLLHSN